VRAERLIGAFEQIDFLRALDLSFVSFFEEPNASGQSIMVQRAALPGIAPRSKG
jgi:hypothetical protein